MPNLDDEKFLQVLGNRLRKAREERQWTQAQLGDACDLHRTFIGSVERGERNLSILNVRLLAKKLRLRLADLFQDLA
jgi:transcriptional regulator with XRE-family HTH domain